MVQSLVANQDISTGEFTPTPLHTELSQLDDSTIITSADSNDTDAFRVALSDAVSPGAGTRTFRVRWRKNASGGNHVVSPTLTLFEGANEIATLSVTDIGATFVTTETTTFAPVTNWANLEVQSGGSLGSGGNPNGRRSLQVAWIEVEVPDPPEVFGSASMTTSSSLVTSGFNSEIIKPIRDIDNHGWTNESGDIVNMYQSVSDDDDSTYVEGGDELHLQLESSAAPDSNENHFIMCRAAASLSGSQFTIYLFENTEQFPLISSWVINPTTTIEDFSLSISSAEVDSITDYTALQLWLFGDTGTSKVYEVQLVKPKSTGLVEHKASVTMSAESSLSTDSQIETTANFVADGDSSLSIGGNLIAPGTVLLSGSSSATFDGAVVKSSTVDVSTDSSFAAEGIIEYKSSVDISSDSSFSASGIVEAAGEVVFDSAATATSDGFVEMMGSVDYSTTSGISYVANVVSNVKSTVTFDGASGFQADGFGFAEQRSSASMGSTSQFGASGFVEHAESLTMESTTSLNASGYAEAFSSIDVSSESDAQFVGHSERTASVTMAGDSDMSTSGTVEKHSSANMGASSSVSFAGVVEVNGSLNLSSTSEFSIVLFGPNKSANVHGTYRLLIDVSAGKWRLVDIANGHKKTVETTGARRKQRPTAGDAQYRVVTVTTVSAEAISIGAASEESVDITPCHKMNVELTVPVR